MRKQYAIIGLGRFGKSVARTLSSLGQDVLAVDSLDSAVQSVANEVTHAVQADAREEETLRALGLRNFDVAVVAIGADIQANILIALMLKEMGVRYVVAKAQNALHGRVLEKIGVDKVVYPEKDMGVRVAHNLVSANVMDCIELMPDYSIVEIITPGSFVNKTLGALNLRAEYGISVMAVKRKDNILVAPGADCRIEEQDTLIIISHNEALARLPE